MAPLTIWDMTDAEHDALCEKLSTIPRDQWPSEIDYDAALLSARLKSMERAEREH